MTPAPAFICWQGGAGGPAPQRVYGNLPISTALLNSLKDVYLKQTNGNNSDPQKHSNVQMDEWINKHGIYIKWNMTQPLKEGDSDTCYVNELEDMMLSEIKLDTKGQTLYDSTYIKYVE